MLWVEKRRGRLISTAAIVRERGPVCKGDSGRGRAARLSQDIAGQVAQLEGIEEAVAFYTERSRYNQYRRDAQRHAYQADEAAVLQPNRLRRLG